MAVKGAKQSLEPICFRLYAQGWTLSSLAARFDVSIVTLSKWKKESQRPGQNYDEWDNARQANIDNGESLRRLFEEQKAYALSLPVSERDTRIHDALSKASANYRHYEEHQRAAAEALLEEYQIDGQTAQIDRPALFLEMLEWMAGKLKESDPEGLKVLANNFDHLVIQFKSEHAAD